MNILLAVSGGVDSMYLAWKRREMFPDSEIAVAHCNFLLRGAESDGDEAFVRDWCAKNAVTLFVRRFDTAEFAAENGMSIEMAARELRYGWFSELCHGTAKELEASPFSGFDAVAVAHNANDNAETLVLNLLRGTGSRGIRGMERETVMEKLGGLHILRPMLDVERQEIEFRMRAAGQAWREDRTNAENDYKRNKIRNLVFPVFSEINPAFIRTLKRDMDHFTQSDKIADEYFQSSRASVEMEDGRIDLKALLGLGHWEYLLWRLLERYSLSEETFTKLVELLKSGRTISGKAFQSPTHLLTISKKTLTPSKKEK